MTLKFQLNIDTTGLTPSQLAAIVQRVGNNLATTITTQSTLEEPGIARYQCAPVYSNSGVAGNWRIITS